MISDVAGLHPRLVVVPPASINGGVSSSIHATVLAVVAVLPHPSSAVNVLVCIRSHPLLTTSPSLCVMVVVPHASVADAVPNALLILAADGLQPIFVAVPPASISGGVISNVHVTVLAIVAVLPQPSIAVNVLVCVLLHPLLCNGPLLKANVGVLHRSVDDAVPNASFISPAVGLHPNVNEVPPASINGGVRSAFHVAVLAIDAVLPHPSLNIHVLVCDRLHPSLLTAPSVVNDVSGPHASVAVAVPNALFISLDSGLHPSESEFPPASITGGV